MIVDRTKRIEELRKKHAKALRRASLPAFPAVDRTERLKELAEKHRLSVLRDTRPIVLRTVDDQISLAEYGVINDQIKKNFDDEQLRDMKEHCRNWKPFVIPELKYPTAHVTELSARAILKGVLP